MHVVATAGHVDHGKSTLVRALTGMEPDRLAEERRRGLTIDLGFAWADIGGTTVAFVDVPGHERFVSTMLAGVGPVPAVLFVVAADAGWQAQSSEHLAVLDAFGVRHGLLVVTRCDVADPATATADALDRIRATSLGDVDAVAVSGRTGAGLPTLRSALLALTERLPVRDLDADVRLWIDRVFSVRGAGTVVTGTLGAGVVRVGDVLTVGAGGRDVVVRALQTLGRPVDEARGVARVAVNVRGVDRTDLRRGDALLTARAWRHTREVDVLVRGEATTGRDLPPESMLHVGSAATACRIRPLGPGSARLTLHAALPLRAGDRGVLRDPGGHRAIRGVDVADADPPVLRGRGAARRRGAELAHGRAAAAYVARHAAVPVATLRALGWAPPGVVAHGWAIDPELRRRLPDLVARQVAAWTAANPLATGLPLATLRRSTAAPEAVLRDAVADAGCVVVDGVVRPAGSTGALPTEVESAVTALQSRFATEPFAAPDAAELAALRLGPRELAAAERAGRLTRLTASVVVATDATARAAQLLATLPAPFTVSDARRALGATRRVTVPLLERLDADGITSRAADGTRRLRRT